MDTGPGHGSNSQGGPDVHTQHLDFKHPNNYTIAVIASVVTSVAIVMSLATFFILRFFCKKRKKSEQLDQMTPQVATNRYTANTIGVRYMQPIKFTLPTITVDGSEPGFTNESDTDKDSHSSFNTGWSSGKNFKSY